MPFLKPNLKARFLELPRDPLRPGLISPGVAHEEIDPATTVYRHSRVSLSVGIPLAATVIREQI